MRPKNSIMYLLPHFYRIIIKKKISAIEDELKTVVKSRLMYEQLILKNESKVFPNKILNHLKQHAGEPYTAKEADKLFKKVSLHAVDTLTRSDDDASIISNHKNEEQNIILIYYDKLKKFITLEIYLSMDLVKYKQLSINDTTLRYLTASWFKMAAKRLLTNGKNLVFPHKINMFVKGKYKSFARVKYGNTKERVHWGNSYDTLKAIAERDAPIIYKRLKDKIITRSQFIIDMKPYVYNLTSSNRPKWIVKGGTDFNLWLIAYSRYSELGNARHYSIVPTFYMSASLEDLGIERNKKAFYSTITSRDDIVHSSKIGFIDKLRMLEQFDMEYCLDTFRHNTDLS